MKKTTYLSFTLVACMGVVSMPLLAEVNLDAPIESAASLTTATIHKEQAAFHKAMAKHYQSLLDAEYGKGGHVDLKEQHAAMAAHHEALSKEHQKAVAIHYTKVKSK